MSYVIVSALAPIFFVLALGFVAGRMRTIDNHHVCEINALVMDFALPASLFVATASTQRSEMMAQGSLFAILSAVMLVPYLFWYVFERQAFRTPVGVAALQALTVGLPNFAAAGLPIVSAILGSKGTVPVAIAIAAGSILPTPITVLLLELNDSKRQADTGTSAARILLALWPAFSKPVVLAPVLGILLSLAGLSLDNATRASLQLIGQAAGGVALFLTGLILSAQSFRLDWQIGTATGTANLIQPLLAAAIVCVFPVPTETAKISVLLSALPSGFFGILLAVNYRLDSAEAGSIVIASTVFSIATLAATIGILFYR
jgi:malonate transporter